MSLTLYGSKPSPYVRRIRMLLAGQPFQFEAINVYDDATRAEYSKISPIRKLPVLVDGEQTVFDSHVIADYLMDKFALSKPSIEDKNLITAIDAVTDSLIILFMGKNSGLQPSPDQLIFKLQWERLPVLLEWLSERARGGDFQHWNFPVMCLIALIDWVKFSDLYDLTDYPDLLAVRDAFADSPVVQETMPEAT